MRDKSEGHEIIMKNKCSVYHTRMLNNLYKGADDDDDRDDDKKV